ncbi:response regulator [Pseudoxanthomonas suwonensis]|uniref:response regulator n=1 Tax=Pseudoxanthomonas suwonensis TaxID=314722 RepID=UPI0006986BDD|nr:response regulator [Pseudoxanthomonas suwonensis]
MSPEKIAFLAGGGELGALMRGYDWAATPLGTPEDWPQSLKTAVRIMLTSRQPIWIGWGEDLLYLYNDPYKSIIGGKHPRALGRPTREVWQEIWPEIGPMLATAMKGDEGTYVEEQLLIMERNGYPEETYYTFSYSPIPNDDGGAGGIICANTDDTRRVIGERQITLLKELAARTANARDQSEACERCAQALATNPRDLPFALLYLADGQDGYRLVARSGLGRGHPAAPELLAAGDASWPVAQALEAHAPQQVADLQARFSGAFASDPGQPLPSRAVVFPILASGEAGRAGALVVGLNPHRLFDESYRGFLSLVAGQISTALANAEAYEEERRRAEALAALDAAKTLFFTNISHEFRTPLTLMLGPLEDLLADTARLDGQHRERVDLAHRNSLRLLRLVNTLLDFSRVEAGRMNAVFRPTDLGALTAELASSFKEATQRAGLALDVDVAGLREPVHVDRSQWEKIVLNLLSNAFKFTFEGAIGVTLEAVDGRARLTVSDTGIGIPTQEQPRLFERFHRVQGAQGRSHEGSGIGLALVAELVGQHGGQIRVESEEGRGSRFIVELPLGTAHLPATGVQEDADPDGEAIAEEAVGGVRARSFVEEAMRWLPEAQPPGTGPDMLPAGGGRAEGGRILLADDNADLRMYIARVLGERGCEVEVVGDGEAALEAIRRARPDLVISDVMMPRLDGFGLLRAIRGDGALRDIPVILLSARSGEEAQVEGLDAGADDYLIKPFSARELVARVESHLAMARLRREATAALRESEDRFRNMADHAPVMMWVTDAEGYCHYLNRSWYEFTGQEREASLGFGWLEAVHPQDRAEAGRVFREANAAQEAFRIDYRLRHQDGGYRWVIDAAAPRFDPAGGFAGYVGSVLDIDERKWQEALRGVQNRMLELAIREGAFADILATIARLVEEHLAPGAAVSIMLADTLRGQLREGAAPGLPAAFREAIDGTAIADGAGSCGSAAFRKAPVHACDIATDPSWTGLRALAVEHGLGACWSIPVLSGRDEVLGVVAVYHPQPCTPSARDIELVELVGQTLLLVIERRQVQEALSDETRVLETLNRTGSALVAELDLERLVQRVTDAGVELTGARFGAFFYNVTDSAGESYTLYTLSGVDRSAFANFPMPRNTGVFAPTFTGQGTLCSDDITLDPRYGRNAPYRGMPEGHLPVRSYLAVPVVSRSGQVLGGLFFGHELPGRFGDRHCRLVEGIAAQAAVAIDNARLYQDAQREIERRRAVEEALQLLNEHLESRVAEEIGVRRQAEAALQQAQKMESIGQLTGGIAHDFNNLLQVISGNLQLLSKDTAGNPRAEQRVQNALAGVSRGSRLAAQLLAFGRRQPLEPKVINVGRFVRGLDDMLRRALGEEIEIETTISGGLWNTLADPGQVENALLNLAINARDAMGGRGRLTIEVGNAFLDDNYVRLHADVRAGQYVMLAVTDTGCGIPQHILDKVFEPFFTTKPEGKGTGLGLSMVYGFARQSDGHVKIYSEVGQGTTIKLYLPRANENEDLLVPMDQQPAVGGSETILVVEDDEEVRATAVEMLSDLGYRVLRAGDAASGLAIVESGLPIDLLFTDVVMPGTMRSPELARKARERIPGIAVLFTSGYTENAIVHGGRLDEGVSLLPKPYTRESLARKIRHVLANRQQAAAATAASARAPAAGAPAGAPASPAAAAVPAGADRRTVLLVEDDALIRMCSAEILQLLGHEVLEAGDALEAAAILDRHRVDLLLTDVELPGASGIELARQVRAAYPGLGLVFATGDEGRLDRDQFPGAVVLRKPYDRAALVTCLAAVRQRTDGQD